MRNGVALCFENDIKIIIDCGLVGRRDMTLLISIYVLGESDLNGQKNDGKRISLLGVPKITEFINFSLF